MTKTEMNQNLCAVLTALRETPFLGAPESTIYLAMGCDNDRYTQVLAVLKTANLVEVRFGLVELTDDGRTMADKIAEFNKQQATAAA